MRTATILTHALAALLAGSAATLSGPALAENADAGVDASQTATALEVRFEGIEAPSGAIMIALFDSEKAYEGDGASARATIAPVTKETAVARFEDLPAGEYAIRAFHDVNGNGQFDTNPFGLPIEPFAFSNNAQPQGGPAPWKAARFVVEPGANAIRIAIK